MPYDGSTDRDNVWPSDVDISLRDTWGLLRLACAQELCYQITATDENNTTDSDYWSVCLNNNGTGILCESDEDCMTLYEFQGGPSLFSTSLFPLGAGSSNAWLVREKGVSYFINYLAGFYITGVAAYDEGGRSTIRGMKVDLSNCNEQRIEVDR